MADFRITGLADAPTDKTDYVLELDKVGIARTTKLLYSTLITESIAASAPVVSTPTITEVLGKTVTTVVSKKAVHGKTHAINVSFSLTLFEEGSIDVIISGDSLGSNGQSLSCFGVVTGANDSSFQCIVVDDSPLTVRLTHPIGDVSAAVRFDINGTLITTS